MNYNRLFKILSIILFLSFLANFSFAIGVYTDEGNYVYYINNNDPTISINISSPLEDIIILGAKINLNGIDKSINSFEKIYLGPSNSKIEDIITFKLSDFGIANITSNDNLYFSLNVEDINHEEIKPNGDPINFKIQLDTIKPRLISFENKDKIVLGINGGYDVNFIFSKKISSYNIKINGILFQNYTNPSNFEKDFLTQNLMTFSSEILNEGENNFSIEYFDLAGNFDKISIPIYFRGENLKLTLLTIRDDSSLKYNYNSNYSDLFNNSIYTKSDIFDLKVKTSKKSTCYFSNSLIGFDYIERISRDNLEQFSTSDNLIHSINIDINDGSKIWVFCRNNAYPDDSLYLSSVLNMGNSLINIEKFDSSPVKITSISPDKTATDSPIDMTVSTSVKSVCFYSLNNGDKNILDTINFLSHSKSLSLNSGNQNFDFSCVDVLNNIDKKTINLKVDLDAGVQISNQDPLYTDKSSGDLKFSISEDTECRYSYENVNPQEFPNLELATGENLQRVIPLSNLAVGNNSIYLYCRKGEGIGKKEINVVFDPEGPKISNIRFINNNIESDFVGSFTSIHLKFDVETLTPMLKYYISISYNNVSTITNYTKSSSDLVLTGNFQDAKSIQIIGENIIEKKSLEVNKNLFFDVEKPGVKISFNKNFADIECFDVGGSGCLNILYELSKTSVCIPTKTYYKNVSVDVTNNNYICAKVTDRAGNSKTTLEPVIFNSLDLDDNGDFQKEIENITNSTSEENSTSGLEYYNDTDVFTNSDSNLDNLDNNSGVNYLLISALAFVLVGIGSGSYYAYKKGYLNEELRKLGIKLPINNNNSNPKNSSSKGRFEFKSTKEREERFKHKISKSSYEKHKEKLNSFLDNQISKGDKILNNFDSNLDSKSKSNSKNLDNFKIKKSKVSKEDVDDFYNSSLKESTLKNNTDVKVDAKDFEEYYKKKKKNLNSKNKVKK